MKRYFTLSNLLIVTVLLISLSCYKDETLDVPVNEGPDLPNTELDQYIQENFTDKYGMAIRYRYVDNFVGPTQRVSPPQLETVRPMLDFIENFWIDPYLEVENGEEFFRGHVPAEIVLLGGLIFNNDGTVVLGTADAGAQITFTNVNGIDPDNEEWRALQLQTVYHEFAHTVHQRYKLPTAYETISATGYTSGGSWFVLTDEDALGRGFVSPYATSSPNEDFAELVAFYLFDEDFDDHFITLTENCETAECEAENAGKELIRQKLASVSDHYKRVTGLDLEEIREAVQAKL